MKAAAVTGDLYQVLGVRRDADQETIKKAFRECALKYHPDKNPGEANEARFKAANGAHAVLSDPSRRALYDEFGKESLSHGFDAQKARWHMASLRHPISAQPRVAGQRGNGLPEVHAVGTLVIAALEWLQTPEGREASRRTKTFLHELFGVHPNEPTK